MYQISKIKENNMIISNLIKIFKLIRDVILVIFYTILEIILFSIKAVLFIISIITVVFASIIIGLFDVKK